MSTNDIAKVSVVLGFKKGTIDRRMFGTFLEPIGSIVYGSLYDPAHPAADENGFRKDVLELLKELGVSFIRYPGGNFVSGYHWKNGIGPKEDRPTIYDFAWNQEDSNQVGIDEFCQLCERMDIEPMLVVNMGSGTMDEAMEELEYCNYDGNSKWAKERRKNGRKEPYNVKLWGLGNEMDGLHQIGHKTPEEYARAAVEYARVMRKMDKDLKMVLCGSCSPEPDLVTYPEWDRIVLEENYNDVDYISLHRYYNYDFHPGFYDHNFDTLDDIAHLPNDIGDYIDTITAAIRYVKGKLRSTHDVAICMDEWGILTSKKVDVMKYGWTEMTDDARAMTALDGVLAGAYLITLLNHCDVVKAACESIVISSLIRADVNKGSYRQTAYYPFRDVAKFGKGTVLLQNAEVPEEMTEHYGMQPKVTTATVYNEEDGTVTVFAANLSKTDAVPLTLDLQGLDGLKCVGFTQMHCDEPFAANTYDAPERIVPVEMPCDEAQRTFDLPPISWSVVRFQMK